MPTDQDVLDRPTPAAEQDAPPRERTAPPSPDRPKPDQPESRRTAEEKGTGAGQGGDKGTDPPKKRRSYRGFIILGLIVLIGAIGGGYYWFTHRNLEDTDDAYTDGRAITIAPQIKGQVVDLRVDDNQFVHAGDLLVAIDPRDYVAARDQAQGQLALARAQRDNARINVELTRITAPAKLQEAQAQVTTARAQQVRAEAEYRRQHAVDPAATTKQNIDQANAGNAQAAAQTSDAEAQVKAADIVPQSIAQAEAQLRQWDAQVVQAQAQLDQAELNLSYTKIVAPQDGWITKRNVERGDYLEVGASMFSLVTTDLWVTANFKETQLDRMRPGQNVRITMDAYPNLHLRGHVDSIQRGSGSKFSAFPAENATGNFIKIVQRVPVKIVIDSKLPPDIAIPLGASVEPVIELTPGGN